MTSLRARQGRRPPLHFTVAIPVTLALLSGTAFASSRPVPDPAPQEGGKAPRATGASLAWPLDYLPRSILSSFGEYRYDRLHAGVDISTGGGTGYRVLAAAPGEVFRLKVEWRGYGRALYLRHPGGRVTVYGHLERYEDRTLGLERLVARRQAESGTRYPGDIYLERPVRVARGQVIAYSGESGVGLPHLHFEVRRDGDAPVDPFETGLPRPMDKRPPILQSLIITAASPDAFIEGESREMSYPLAKRSGTIVTTASPIRLAGPFLAALTAYDPAGDAGRAGVGVINVAMDGEPRYRLALRAFRFDQNQEAGLIFDHRFSRLGPPAFAYRLYRLPGNDFAGTTPGSADAAADVYPGAFSLTPGSHLMEIDVVDAHFNHARASICIQVGETYGEESFDWDGPSAAPSGVRFHLAAQDPARSDRRKEIGECPSPPPDVQAELWDETRRQFRSLQCNREAGVCSFIRGDGGGPPTIVRLRVIRHGVPGSWRLLVRGPSNTRDPEQVAARVETWPSAMDFLATLDAFPGSGLRLAAGQGRDPLSNLLYRGDRTYGAALGYTRAAGRAPFFVTTGNQAAPLASLALDARWVEAGSALDYAGPGFEIHLPEKARFFPGPLVIRTDPVPGAERLPSVADAVEILPAGESLNDRGILAFDVAPGVIAPETLGIYRWDPVRSRWAYEGGEIEEKGSRLALRFRRYGRFALLQDASPPEILEVRPAPGARLSTARPAIVVRVEDEGRSLDYDGVTIELDGRRLESEFDPDRGLSKVLDPPRLAPGSHHLKIFAVDLAGNVSPEREEDFVITGR